MADYSPAFLVEVRHGFDNVFLMACDTLGSFSRLGHMQEVRTCDA